MKRKKANILNTNINNIACVGNLFKIISYLNVFKFVKSLNYFLVTNLNMFLAKSFYKSLYKIFNAKLMHEL